MTEELSFSFPFEPYDIQSQFMNALYKALDGSKCGIFESPTGTGKSLSLICGSLTWLSRYMANYEEKLEKLAQTVDHDDSDTEDWFDKAVQKKEKDDERRQAKRDLEILNKQKKRVANLRKIKIKKASGKLNPNINHQPGSEVANRNSEDLSVEDDLILDEYHSDIEDDFSTQDDEVDEIDDGCLKIFYCSRTHSQLSQFIREIQKTSFAEEVRVIPLASRTNLCINDEVLNLKHLTLMNDKCIDLQKHTGSTKDDKEELKPKRKRTGNGCPYYKPNALQNLADQLLIQVQDLEEMENSGRKSKSCPYYASRYSIKDAQIVVLPYNTLLHKKTRESSKIKLKGNVVIIDEAHNLLETIANIHSVSISSGQFSGAHSQLMQYMQKYEKRLSAKNLLYIKQIIFFLKRFLKLLTSGASQGDANFSCSKTIPQTLADSLTDNLNLYKLLVYMERSKLAQKLHGFSKTFQGSIKVTEKIPQPDLAKAPGAKTLSFLQKMMEPKQTKVPDEPVVSPAPQSDAIIGSSPLLSIIEFIRILVNPSSDGRIFFYFSDNAQKSYLKYLLLNPASQFHDIVKECRSVIVAGGTMSPMEEFREQLFLSVGAPIDRIVEFTCGHVVSSSNVMPIALSYGPSNIKLDFTYNNRLNPQLLDELGRILINISKIIPGGIVCFLPSYEYETKVFGYFSKNSVVDKLSVKKKVFREPRKSSELDKVLTSYSNVIKESRSEESTLNGAILFSVVGGKMSEGINFGDDLGRCVVMIGLPYPNKYSPELNEKMNYLNSHHKSSCGTSAGSVFYENLCFKAVNQSIGRSIRHK